MSLTYGVGVDLPMFPNKPIRNDFSDTTFGYRTDVVPESQLWSPLVGFNYLLSEDGREQVRGDRVVHKPAGASQGSASLFTLHSVNVACWGAKYDG